jgi:predicted CoA-substrate-specific enzyme activase
MKFIGIDTGSVSVKIVAFDEKGSRLYNSYERHKGHPLPVLVEKLNSLMNSGLLTSESSLSITGSAGKLIASILGIEPVNEIVAQAYATHKLFPHIKTIIEMGGEDSKLIILSKDGRSVTDFSMNSVCAAGTGSFLDQQAERLRLTIDEFSELALKSKKPPRIAGRCSVFAKSDMIHLQQIATPVEDIVAGLCFAVARNFKGSISRGKNVEPPVSFQGGVAANKGMARAFKEIFKLNELFVPEEYALLGAIGAALKDMHENRIQHVDLSKLEDFIQSSKPFEKGHPPLSDQTSIPAHQTPAPWEPERATKKSERIKAYLGIDVGSISTNLAVIDEHGRLLSKRYLMTAGRPIEAVNQGLSEVGEEVGDRVKIMGVATTGSGRYMIADYVGADIVKNEITAHATAAIFIDNTIDTIFEIGGQDSKYISLKDSLVVDFEMNKACAAGTGSFLEEQAEKLNISIKKEFEQSALSAHNPCRLGERCTVFMENSLMSNLQRGAEKDDLLAGLAYSIVQNYINRVVAGKAIGDKITFLGGVAFNKAVMAAFEKYLGKKIIVPTHHEVAGAIGMALIAMRHMIAAPSQCTKFKGVELSKKPYEISSFECRSCPNVCEINRVKIKDEKKFLFYGGRCEKYDVRRKKATGVPDLFAFRDDMLWKEHLQRQALFNKQHATTDNESKDAQPRTRRSRARIGIPFLFFFHDYLPFFSALLWELGFEVEVSPKTNRQVVNLGLERVLSEACFPVKLALGHISYLLDKDIDAIFMPSFVNLSAPEDRFERGAACPHTQTIPYISRIAFEELKTIAPVINFRLGRKYLFKELWKALKPFGIKRNALSKAIDSAYKAQDEFNATVKSKGTEVLSSLDTITIAIIGRSYNALDSGANLEIPQKLADLGILSIPFDFLPFEKYSIDEDWPNMYWKSGQNILKAARFVRDTKNLYAIFIGNFLCGADSFIMEFFRKDIGHKPFLHLEIDEHSADAGIITRCEAFIDSLTQKAETDYAPSVKRHKKVHAYQSSSKERTLYLPLMSDHALALVAAFEYCGVRAEALPESDKETAEYGKRFTSGKECYPCTVTTGDMIKKVMQPDFDPAKSAFFMPSGTGPCRFGQYNIFHRMILDSLGHEQVPIFAPNQDTTFYSDLGIVGKHYTMHAWKGIIAYELLLKSLHETRPYEKKKGSTDELYKTYREKLFRTLKDNSVDIEKVLQDIRKDFGSIPLQKQEKPLIGVIGEIFVRSHKFSNENLIKKVEALGGEVWLAPVEEWLYYVNYMGLTKAFMKKDIPSILNFVLKRHVQKKIEHKCAHHFEGFLKTLHEPETKKIIDMAAPYVHKSFEGETILSIGKTMDLIEKGASGIINAMPFGCMPGTIVTAMLRGVNRDYGIPCMSIPYDGTESSTIEIQLEAFIDQAKNYSKRSH